jgi:hypothetical protein
MDDDGHAHRHAGVDVIERSQTYTAENIKSSHHARSRDGGADHQQKAVGEKEKISNRNFVGIKENPVVKNNAEPDHKGKECVEEKIPDGMKKFQASDKFDKKFMNFLGNFLWERFQEKGNGCESLLSKKINCQDENNQN